MRIEGSRRRGELRPLGVLVVSWLAIACPSLGCSDDGSAGGGMGGAGGETEDGSGGAGGVGSGGAGTGGAGGQATPCTVLPQAGCPAAQSCDFDQGGVTYCRAVQSGGNETQHCSSAAQCDLGYGCFGTGTASECLHYCQADSDCSGPGSRCVTSAPSPAPTGTLLCTQSCDPVMATTGCPTGWNCGVFAQTDRVGTYCVPAGGQPQQGPCTDNRDCLPDYSCVGISSGAHVCKQTCVAAGGGVNGAGVCALGYACHAFVPTVAIGGKTYGACDRP
jgi:hypothetical protein